MIKQVVDLVKDPTLPLNEASTGKDDIKKRFNNTSLLSKFTVANGGQIPQTSSSKRIKQRRFSLPGSLKTIKNRVSSFFLRDLTR